MADGDFEPRGEERWICLNGVWNRFIFSPEVSWWQQGEDGQIREMTERETESAKRVFQDYDSNRLKYFKPHGGGKDFLNDWTNGILLLTAPSRVGKSCHGVIFGLTRTLNCEEHADWPIFSINGVVCPEYRGERRLVISSYQWGNVSELWEEYRLWTPRDLLGPYAPSYGKYDHEHGVAKNLSFESGKSQRLRLKDGTELVFLCDMQRQGAWEGKRWDDHHVDEQRMREKWIGYLRGTANTKGLVQAGFTLTGHILPDRPDTGTAGWVYQDLVLGAYNYGKTVGRYSISMDDVPSSVLNPKRKAELKEQWVDGPTRNQDEEMLRKGEARYKGKWESGGGLVINNFDPVTHIIPDVNRKHPVFVDATKCRAIDHGLSRPCGALLGASFAWGDLLVYAEYYERGRTVPYHAIKIVEMSGNKRRQGEDYNGEECPEPIPTYEEVMDGTKFSFSVLDGRSFNTPAQERAITLGHLYNDCGLFCTAACTSHNKKQDDRTGVVPNMLRYFTKQPDRPHIMWHFHRKKMISDAEYNAWLESRGGDWKNGAQIYFVRSLRWTFDEIHKWSIDPTTKLPMYKDDHIMACLRYMTAENPRYLGPNWKDEDAMAGDEFVEDEIDAFQRSSKYVGYYT